MKDLVQKQKMKFAGLCLAIGMSAAVNAQTVTGTDVLKSTGKTNIAGTIAPVRVVDNKGTVKYLQVNNGLTQIVNTTNERTTTTWQLGGTLTENTYIDATGKVFALDGIELTTALPSTADQVKSKHGEAGAAGFTLLVRDEVTGAVKKLLMPDLVKGGSKIVTSVNGDASTNASFTDPTLPNDVSKIAVYRNGIKLLVGTNYTLNTSVAGAYQVTILGTAGTAATATVPESDDYYALAATDVIEAQWIQ